MNRRESREQCTGCQARECVAIVRYIQRPQVCNVERARFGFAIRVCCRRLSAGARKRYKDCKCTCSRCLELQNLLHREMLCVTPVLRFSSAFLGQLLTGAVPPAEAREVEECFKHERKA